MDLKETLVEIGLREGEAEIYLALLKLGTTTVAKIKETTTLYRTTIYDFLEKLLKKGLVSYVVRNNVKFFTAASPEKLQAFLSEKQERVQEAIPQLKQLSNLIAPEVKVETYKGKEGFKTVFNDILRASYDVFLFGIEEEKFMQNFPGFIEIYLKKQVQQGMKELTIVKKGTKHLYSSPNTIYRFLPEKYFGPTPTMIYGNKVAVFIWDPLTVVVIENKALANAYGKWFKLMWEMADKKK